MKILNKLFLIIISIFFSLIIVELLLTISGKYNKLSNKELIISDTIYEKPKSSTLKNKHPDLNIIIKNKYDSSGIRNHDYLDTKNKKNIIAIFGDSHVENINIKNDLQFTTLLDNYFESDNYVNYGVGGYSIDQIFIRYLSFQLHDIKHVYYIFSANDAGSIVKNNLIVFDNDSYKILKPKLRLFEKLIGKLNITYFLIDIYYKLRSQIYNKHTTINIVNYPKKLAEKLYYKSLEEKNSSLEYSENLVYFNKILKTFKEEVNNNNSKFSIIVLPSKNENIEFNKMVFNKNNYNIINLYEDNIDEIKSFDREVIFKNDSHFNEYGNLLIFQLMLKILSNNNSLKNLNYISNIKTKIDELYNSY
jgi:hypothetical protein